MKFYAIKLNEIPRILFAFRADIKNYRNEFRCKPKFIEITCGEEGNIVFHHENGHTEVRGPGLLSAIFSDYNCTTTALNGERQKHLTVGIQADYSFSVIDSKSHEEVNELKIKQAQDKMLLLIPCCMELGEHQKEIKTRLKRIIRYHHSDSVGSEVEAIAEWFAMVSFITKLTLNKLDDSNPVCSPAEEQYAAKAIRYIQENYAEKISVRQIADHLSLSEGYLHRIFKKSQNITILEYISRYRVGVAIDLIQNRNLSLAEAAAGVGIEDPAYMSRLFKKVTGLCCRDYFKSIAVATKIV